ncbi:MAG TPA: OmpH family outer membrane protein [Bacteroidetes bacterium]|nr:OmpH family outer membrane protein [Bacteroidota bacterium]
MTLRFLFLALLALGAAQAEAQSLKVGVIDPDLIVTRMPEYAQVQGEINQLEAQIGATLQAKQDSARAINNELVALADSPLVTDEARQEKESELRRLVTEMQQGEEQGLRLLSNEEVRLLRPALIRLNTAISEAAEEAGIDLVMTPVANNAPLLIYANFDSENVVDLTQPVLDKLGIVIEAPAEGTAPQN